MLLKIKMHSIYAARGNHAASIEEMALDFFADLPVRRSQANAPSFTAFKLRRNRAFRSLDSRRRDNKYLRYGHTRLNVCSADGGYKGKNALGRTLCVVLGHGLEVVCSQHKNNQFKR